MIALALILIAESGNWRAQDVEARYRAALDQTMACQRDKAIEFVQLNQPVLTQEDDAVVDQITPMVIESCADKTSEYLAAVAARVALRNPAGAFGKNRQRAIVEGVTRKAEELMARTARASVVMTLRNLNVSKEADAPNP